MSLKICSVSREGHQESDVPVCSPYRETGCRETGGRGG